MSAASLKARSSWLLSFADVVTLLITFFIMMLALNHTEISRIQNWTDDQLDQSYLSLSEAVQNYDLQYINVNRNTQGIFLSISHPESFERGGFEVSPGLAAELSQVSTLLSGIAVFNAHETELGRRIIQEADQDGMDWRVEVVVEGHTDNDPIPSGSILRNNWFLSTMRAQNVMQLLHRNSGLRNDYFSVAGFGEHRPIASNETLEGKGQNRRVNIVINAGFTRK